MKKYTRNIRFLVAATVTVAALNACANRGQGPQGGPKDETPPSVVKSFPNNKSLNVTKGKVEIIFDENVNVLKASDNVIISPPQRIAPEVKSYAKTVTVQLNDTLIPNTTYSINFGDAIVDNNESNPLKNYFFAFSTGNEIDTMQIAGTVIDAQNLNPVPGVTVGIYDDLSDTVFMKKPFLRISRTDNMGRFTVPNVRNGKYRVYALTDGNRDNFYQPGEALAYSQSVFTTTFENYMRSDTIWKDSVTVDTIMSVPAIRYLPDNVVLHYFKDETTRQYLVKSERTVPHRISMYFNTAAEHLPEIKALNVADWDKKILLQKNEKLDSLTYWFTDSTLIKNDTINLEVKYLKSDSAFQLKPQTDTISFVMKKLKGRTATKPSQKIKTEFLTINSNLAPQFEVYNPITLNFDAPIKSIDTAKIHFYQMKDTIQTPLNFRLQRSDSVGMKYIIRHKWIPETTYRLVIDSAAFFSLYDRWNDKLKSELKIKSLDEYSGLKLHLKNFEPAAIFQVVDKNDQVIRTAPALEKGTLIEHLTPGDYYVRLFIDRNRDGKWTTGSYLFSRQPEEVYYYPKPLKLIKNWEFEETWDYNAIPLLQQKPKDLIKTPKGSGNENN